jgi:thioesterase domain-containing protein
VSGRDLPANILPLNAIGSERSLFCLHPGYGLISDFHTLAQSLDGIATVYGVQSPVYSDPGWRAASFDDMAADYVERICRIAPEGYCSLLGWSFGGRLAVVMARHFALRERPLGFVGLVDIGPNLDGDEATELDISRLAAELPIFLANTREIFRGEVSQIMSGQSMEDTIVSDDLTAANEQRLVDTIVEVALHHYALLRQHRYSSIAAMLHLWWATHTARNQETSGCWDDYTSGEVKVVDTLDATHTTIIRHPALAAQVRDILMCSGPADASVRRARRR